MRKLMQIAQIVGHSSTHPRHSFGLAEGGKFENRPLRRGKGLVTPLVQLAKRSTEGD
jgi:hypothetical protein